MTVLQAFQPALIIIVLLVIRHYDRTRHRVWICLAAAAVVVYSLAGLYAMFF